MMSRTYVLTTSKNKNIDFFFLFLIIALLDHFPIFRLFTSPSVRQTKQKENHLIKTKQNIIPTIQDSCTSLVQVPSSYFSCFLSLSLPFSMTMCCNSSDSVSDSHSSSAPDA